MKLVCDACGSKYSISDDRVAGKVFKIRCKKCSQVIVVRGAQPVEAAAPAPSGEWHVVIDGQQGGPFEREELLRRHAAGELDDESFVWRDGMEEWAALGTIAELRGESTRVEPASDRFETAASGVPAHELFATSAFATNASEAPAHELAASTPSPSRGRRAAMTASAFGGSAVVATDDSKRLLAERNENSVLFTLGNLAKLASPAPPKAANTSSAGTEGSGLIDIRALASTFAAPSAKAATAVGSIEDLPVYAPATFGEPIVLMPTASRGPDRKLMYMLLAAITVLAIVATVLVFVVMRGADSRQVAALDNNGNGETRDNTGPTGNGSTAAGNGTGNSTGTGTGAVRTMNNSADNSTGTGSTGTAATGSSTNNSSTGSTTGSSTSNASSTGSTGIGTRPTTASTSTRPTTSSASTRPATSTSTRPTTTSTASTRPTSTTTTSTTGTRPTTSTSTTSTRPTTTSTTTRPTTAPDRVQCEFSNYAEKGCEVFRPATSNTSASNLPENLDRAAIAAGLGTIRAQACGGRSSTRGDVAVTIKVNADGGVSGVTIKSSPDPVLSSCVTAAAGKGTFAKTRRGSSFGYVWRF